MDSIFITYSRFFFVQCPIVSKEDDLFVLFFNNPLSDIVIDTDFGGYAIVLPVTWTTVAWAYLFDGSRLVGRTF